MTCAGWPGRSARTGQGSWRPSSPSRAARAACSANACAAARFVPLYQGGEVPTAASVAQASAAIAALGPLDAVVLGMGANSVRVEVHKPDAPVPADFADISVVVERFRS